MEMLQGTQTANWPKLTTACEHGDNLYYACAICEKKAAQVAAIRQRVIDVSAGASGCKYHHEWPDDAAYYRFCDAVSRLFKVDRIEVEVNGADSCDLDSLAAWLWERGVR